MQNDVLDVAIGVVFIWFLVSSALSLVNEAIALLARVRAKHLWLGVGRLFDPAKSKFPNRFLDSVLWVPLGAIDARPDPGTAPSGAWAKVTSAISGALRWLARKVKKTELGDVRQSNLKLYDKLAPQVEDVARPGTRSKLTHIPASVVSDALVTLARRVYPADLKATAAELDWSSEEKAALAGVVDAENEATAIERADLIQLAPAPLTSAQLGELYDRAANRLTGRDVAAYLEGNTELGDAVRRAAASVASDQRVLAVKSTIDQWFDREMAQVSALYRRQSRKILAILALPAILFLDVNTVQMVRDLSNDSNLRAAVVNSAIGDAAGSAIPEDVSCPPTTTTTAATTTTTMPPATSTTSTTIDPLTESANKLGCGAHVIGKLKKFGVGFTMCCSKVLDQEGWIGRPITFIAILFGAQFWFDVLRRLVGLRKPSAKSAAPGS